MNEAQNSATPPLDGIRVIDLTSFLAGPYGTRLLADSGAEVIKVEQPGGDMIRNSGPMSDGHSRYFGHMNCGKKSVTLNLKSDQGRADFLRLVASADILIENFRPGVMKRLGFSYTEIKKVNPKIIYCSISGYGQTGSDAHKPAFAPIINASCGYDMTQFNYLDGELEKPMRNRNTAPDVLGGTHAFGAIAAALFQRERTGDGQYIDVAMIDCMHNMMGVEFQLAQTGTDESPLVFEAIRCADGFLMVAPFSKLNFEAFAKATENDHWLTDPRFSETKARRLNYRTMLMEAEVWSLTQSTETAEKIVTEAGCPCSKFLSVRESQNRPSMQERGAVVEITDSGGSYLVANTPFQFANGTIGLKPRVSAPGEHNAEFGIED